MDKGKYMINKKIMIWIFVMFCLIIPGALAFTQNITGGTETFYLKRNFTFDKSFPTGTETSVSSSVSGGTNVTFAVWTRNQTENRSYPISTSMPPKVWGWIRGVPGNRIYFYAIFYEQLQNGSLEKICRTENSELTTSSIAYVEGDCETIYDPFIAYNSTIIYNITAVNIAGNSATGYIYYDGTNFYSGFNISEVTTSLTIQDDYFSPGETIVTAITDSENLSNYTLKFYDSNNTLICDLSGTSPEVPNQIFYRSCQIPVETQFQNDSYIVYTNEDYNVSSKVYFDIVEVQEGMLIQSVQIGNNGNFFLGQNYGLSLIAYDNNSIPITNANCKFDIYDESGTLPFISKTTVTNADGRAVVTLYADPSLFKENREYGIIAGCWVVNGSIPANSLIRANSAGFFEVNEWFSPSDPNITNKSDDFYASSQVTYCQNITNNFDGHVDGLYDVNLYCDDVLVNQKEEIIHFDSLEELKICNDFEIKKEDASKICYFGTQIGPSFIEEVDYELYSNYFSIIDPVQYINITGSKGDMHINELWNFNLTVFNPKSQFAEEQDIEIYFLMDDIEFFYQHQNIFLNSSEYGFYTISVPFLNQALVDKPDVGWLKQQYSTVKQLISQEDQNVSILIKYKIDEETSYDSIFTGYLMKRPGEIHSIDFLDSMNGSPSNSYVIDQFGDVKVWLKYNMTSCEASTGEITFSPRNYYLVYSGGNGPSMTLSKDVLILNECTSSIEFYDELNFNFLEVVGMIPGQYDLYADIWWNNNPIYIGEINVTGSLPAGTLEQRQTVAMENQTGIMASIANYLSQIRDAILGLGDTGEQGENLRVETTDWSRIGSTWEIFAYYTYDNGNPIIINASCSTNTNFWGIINMSYDSLNERYVGSHIVDTTGDLTWTVTCTS